MRRMSPRAFAAALAMLAALSAPARAEGPAFGTVLRQEWIGAEVAPLSLNQGSPPYDEPPSRFQPGAGLKLRLFRHRWWQGAYWTPLQAGGFLGHGGGEDGTLLIDMQTEGGAIFRFGAQTIEAGLGVGAGLLAISYGEINTSDLVIGGLGWMLSPVVRYLLREKQSHTLGLVLRAQIPLSGARESSEHPHYTAHGMLFLVAFDVGFGRG